MDSKQIALLLLFFSIFLQASTGEAAARISLESYTSMSQPRTLPPQLIDPNNQIQFDFSPYLILYKSGRVRRLIGSDTVPASIDIATGVTSKDVVIDKTTGLAARLYLPNRVNVKNNVKLPILVYFHGGAFVVESAFSQTYHHFLNVLVSKAKVVAVSVDYRLAPEHPIPTAYDDSWAALKWVITNAISGPEQWLAKRGDLARLFVAGDSAGGNIAHNLAVRAGDKKLDHGVKIKGMVLLDPYFAGPTPVGAESSDPSYRQNVERNWQFICAGRYGIDSPLVNPLALPASEWRKLGCDRALVTVAELDTLRDRGRAYVAALQSSGWAGQAQLYQTLGEGHCYFLDMPDVGKARHEMAAVVAFINTK